MPTKYASKRSNYVKQTGYKLDLRSTPTKSPLMADLRKQLEDAQKRLEQKKAENDVKAVAKLNEIIEALQGTIARQK